MNPSITGTALGGLRRWSLVAAAALSLFSGVARADVVFAEMGDAGQTVATAQDTINLEPLNAITGSLSDAFDVDLFRIRINNPASFFAATTNLETGDLDTQLFLLSSTGLGIMLNDDRSSSFASQLDSFIGAGGFFLLGISSGGMEPLDANGQFLFADPGSDTTQLRGRNPSSLTLSSFDSSAVFLADQSGAYRIDLRGASVAVPEPATALLVALAGFAAFGTSRRRQARAAI